MSECTHCIYKVKYNNNKILKMLSNFFFNIKNHMH